MGRTGKNPKEMKIITKDREKFTIGPYTQSLKGHKRTGKEEWGFEAILISDTSWFVTVLNKWYDHNTMCEGLSRCCRGPLRRRASLLMRRYVLIAVSYFLRSLPGNNHHLVSSGHISIPFPKFRFYLHQIQPPHLFVGKENISKYTLYLPKIPRRS